MKPICFLDVDGVLNVFDAPDDWNDNLFWKNLTFPNPRNHDRLTQRQVILDRRHPNLLALLAADFDIVWATAWRSLANAALSDLLGLPQLPVVEFPHRGGVGGLHWKTPKLADWADGRPFIWIDDEARTGDASWLTSVNPNAMVLRCDPTYGLTDKHVLTALDFAAVLAGSKT